MEICTVSPGDSAYVGISATIPAAVKDVNDGEGINVTEDDGAVAMTVEPWYKLTHADRDTEEEVENQDVGTVKVQSPIPVTASGRSQVIAVSLL